MTYNRTAHPLHERITPCLLGPDIREFGKVLELSYLADPPSDGTARDTLKP